METKQNVSKMIDIEIMKDALEKMFIANRCEIEEGPLCLIMEFAHFGSLRTILRASRGDGVARNLQNGAELIVQLKKTQYTNNDVYKASPDIDANRPVPKVVESTTTSYMDYCCIPTS